MVCETDHRDSACKTLMSVEPRAFGKGPLFKLMPVTEFPITSTGGVMAFPWLLDEVSLLYMSLFSFPRKPSPCMFRVIQCLTTERALRFHPAHIFCRRETEALPHCDLLVCGLTV